MSFRILDAHVHFWTIAAPSHAWPGPDLPLLYRDTVPAEYLDTTRGLDLVGAVIVQAQTDDRETDWLLSLCDAEPRFLGAVGWVGLDRADAPDRIAAIAAHPRLLGLRPMLQAIEDSDWILRDDVSRGVAAMLQHGLRFDALVQPRHLPALRRFAERWPDLPIVIDHGAKPEIARGTIEPWRTDIAALAALPNVWCKLSGLRTEQAPGQPADDLAPYVDHLLACFGTRLMWGSDWPVIRLAGDEHADWLGTTRRLTDGLSEEDAARLFEGAAREFYGLAE